MENHNEIDYLGDSPILGNLQQCNKNEKQKHKARPSNSSPMIGDVPGSLFCAREDDSAMSSSLYEYYDVGSVGNMGIML